jgi:hypothetical protein
VIVLAVVPILVAIFAAVAAFGSFETGNQSEKTAEGSPVTATVSHGVHQWPDGTQSYGAKPLPAVPHNLIR